MTLPPRQSALVHPGKRRQKTKVLYREKTTAQTGIAAESLTAGLLDWRIERLPSLDEADVLQELLPAEVKNACENA